MSTVISADRSRVWSALTKPTQLIRWDERLLALLEPVGDAAHVGQRLRWRYRLGTVPVLLREELVEVVPFERLRADLSFGLMRATTTYSLATNGNPNRTRISLKIAALNSVPVVGGEIDRFEVRHIATSFVDTKLRHLSVWFDANSESLITPVETNDHPLAAPPAAPSPA